MWRTSLQLQQTAPKKRKKSISFLSRRQSKTQNSHQYFYDDDFDGTDESIMSSDCFQSLVSITYALHQMKDHSDNELIQEAALDLLLQNLNQNVGCCHMIASAGGTQQVSQAMIRFCHKIKIQRLGCEIGFLLAGMDLCPQEPALTRAILSALKHHAQHCVALVTVACATLQQLIAKSPANASVLAKANAMKTLVQTMNIYEEHPFIQEAVLLLLGTILKQKRKGGKYKIDMTTCTTTLSAILHAMMAHPYNPTIQRYAKALLSFWMTEHYNKTVKGFVSRAFLIDPFLYIQGTFADGENCGGTTLQFLVTRSGIVLPILQEQNKNNSTACTLRDISETLRIHPNNLPVVMSALVASLYSLSQGDFSDFAPIVADTMMMHPASTCVQATGCLVLGATMISTGTSVNEVLQQCLRPVLLALQTHHEDAYSLILGLSTLTVMLRKSPYCQRQLQDNARSLTRYITHGAIMSQRHKADDGGIQQLCCTFLTSLFQSLGDSSRSSNHHFKSESALGVAKAVVHGLKQYQDNVGCQLHGLQALHAIMEGANEDGFGNAASLILPFVAGNIFENHNGTASLERQCVEIVAHVYKRSENSGFSLDSLDWAIQRKCVRIMIATLSHDWCKHDPDAQRDILLALLTALLDGSVHGAIDFVEAEGIEAIVSTMTNPQNQSSMEIQWKSGLILRTLRKYYISKAMDRALNVNASAMIKIVLHQHRVTRELDMQKEAVYVFAYLLNWLIKSDTAQVGPDAAEALVYILNFYRKNRSNDDRIAHHALEALCSLSKSKVHCERMLKTGGINAVVDTTILALQTEEVQPQVLVGFQILCNISGEPHLALRTLKAGGLYLALYAAAFAPRLGNAFHRFNTIRLLYNLVKAFYWHSFCWRLVVAVGR